MQILGQEILDEHMAQEHFLLKLLANERAVCFFSAEVQHRDMRVLGLKYDDDYSGNALAGLVKPKLLEFRYHREFSAERVRTIVQTMRPLLPTNLTDRMTLIYHGREIGCGGKPNDP